MSNSLGPAFSYSPSPPTRHQPQSSESSFASVSTSSSSTRSSSTSYTSSYCSYEEEEEEEEDDHGSVLEDLYELANVKSDQSSPPRLARDSSQQLRERTRYRSSASIHPPAQIVQPSSRPLPNSSMDFAALLASLPPSLDTCFCGQAVEEDSIYCSRRCAQEDALNALCGSSGAEDSDRASLVSGSSGSTSQSGESHYRRVEREEVRREKERQAKIARERSAARRKAREGASVSSAGSSGSKKGSLWRSNVDVGSLKASTSSSCSRSSRRAETPSLSSSISSLSSTSSPISPSFPPASVSSQSLSHPTPVILAPTEPPRPTTPSPPSHLQEMNDIYSSYLTTTPLAPSSESKHLRTPTQHFGINSNSTPRSTYPQTPYDEDEDEESPTGRAARLRAEQQGTSASSIGMRMLQLSSYPSSPSDDLLSESLDHVQTEAPSLGWGHREMQDRMNRKQGRSGHTKGKLSFEDVVGILGA